MKSYKDFVSESYAARENLNEVLGLGKLAGLAYKGAKLFSVLTPKKGSWWYWCL